MIHVKQRKEWKQDSLWAKVSWPRLTNLRLHLLSILPGPQSYLSGKSAPSVEGLRSVPSGWCAIPNPDYDERASSNKPQPRYAVFRLTGMLNNTEQSVLYHRVNDLWDVKLPFHVIKTRGSDFHQWWLGVWTRYAAHPVISLDSRKPNREELVRALTRDYDQYMGNKTRRYLARLDPPVARSMLTNHRKVSQYLNVVKAEYDENLLHQASNGKRDTFKATADAMSRRSPVDYRLGGMGTMLAVSWGEGTDWHRDTKDQESHYTILTCLNHAAVLHLPELGYSVKMKPGDVVGLLAYKYLHKLEPVRTGRITDARQVIFTCWTDANTEAGMNNHNL